MILPTAAIDLLNEDKADAEALAAQGEIEAGYRVLMAGLERTNEPRYAGKPWIETLRHHYDDAMADYANRHDFVM